MYTQYMNKDTRTTLNYVAERVQIKKKPAHITHIEFSFYLSLIRSSETLWFERDNGTTFTLYLHRMSVCLLYTSDAADE